MAISKARILRLRPPVSASYDIPAYRCSRRTTRPTRWSSRSERSKMLYKNANRPTARTVLGTQIGFMPVDCLYGLLDRFSLFIVSDFSTLVNFCAHS